jgi:hypothetical protein
MAEAKPYILENISVAPNGCWNWLRGKGACGYGHLHIDKKCLKAHRVSYEVFIGPIPRGLHIDHLCRNRACVNPHHLEPVTCKVNLLRGESFSAVNAAKTHCHRGHELSGDNLFKRRGNKRGCKQCKSDYFKARRRLKNPSGKRGPEDQRGELGSAAKFTSAQIIEVRKLHAIGVSNKDIAQKYAVDRSTISRIVNGHRYTNAEQRA